MVLPEPDRPLTMKKLIGRFFEQRLVTFDQIFQRIDAPGTQDVGASRGLDQHREVAAGCDVQHDLGDLDIQNGTRALLCLQPVDLAHAAAVELLQAHAEVQFLAVAYRGFAEHQPDIEDAESAHFEIIRVPRDIGRPARPGRRG